MKNQLSNSIAKIWMQVFFIMFFSLLMISQVIGQNVTWPNGKKAAIILTYDDGLESQLDIVIPQLNKAKIHGTFFLCGDVAAKNVIRWETASKEGHELGNHSINHPCASSVYAPLTPRFASENYDVCSILKEINIMNRLLFAINRKEAKSYAYPCAETTVGGIDYSDTLRLSKLSEFARVAGDANSIITDFKTLNVMKVPAYPVVKGTEGHKIIDFIKNVQRQHGLGVLVFHGVGGDYLQVSAQAHQELVKYLAEHRDEIWVDTFQNVLEYVMK